MNADPLSHSRAQRPVWERGGVALVCGDWWFPVDLLVLVSSCHYSQISQTREFMGQHTFLPVVEAGQSKMAVMMIPFLVTAFFLACRQPPPSSVLTCERWIN